MKNLTSNLHRNRHFLYCLLVICIFCVLNAKGQDCIHVEIQKSESILWKQDSCKVMFLYKTEHGYNRDKGFLTKGESIIGDTTFFAMKRIHFDKYYLNYQKEGEYIMLNDEDVIGWNMGWDDYSYERK